MFYFVFTCLPFLLLALHKHLLSQGQILSSSFFLCLDILGSLSFYIIYLFHVFGGFLEGHISIPIFGFLLDMSVKYGISRKMKNRNSIVYLYLFLKLNLLLCIFQVAGVAFPPREKNSVPLFTPPQNNPVTHQPVSARQDAAIEVSRQSDDASGLRY